MTEKKTFSEHFKYSMDSFPGGGLPVPSSVFDTAQSALATIGLMTAALSTQAGITMTLSDLALRVGLVFAGGAVTTVTVVAAAEASFAIAGVMAAGYTGACIGAFAYAVGQYSAENWVDPVYDWFEAVNICKRLIRDAPSYGCSVHPTIRGRLKPDMLAGDAGAGPARNVPLPVNKCNASADQGAVISAG